MRLDDTYMHARTHTVTKPGQTTKPGLAILHCVITGGLLRTSSKLAVNEVNMLRSDQQQLIMAMKWRHNIKTTLSYILVPAYFIL